MTSSPSKPSAFPASFRRHEVPWPGRLRTATVRRIGRRVVTDCPTPDLAACRLSAWLLTAVVVVVGLLAKGAIAGFYLRERGSYSEDGAAYLTAGGEFAAT